MYSCFGCVGVMGGVDREAGENIIPNTPLPGLILFCKSWVLITSILQAPSALVPLCCRDPVLNSPPPRDQLVNVPSGSPIAAAPLDFVKRVIKGLQVLIKFF